MSDSKRLLVINDEPDMLSQIQRWLSREGYIINSTLQGREGVELVKNDHYDLILLDYNLKKEKDGEKTAKAFIPQLIKVNPLIPIIVISATETNISAKELGIKNVLIVDSSFWKKLLSLVKATLGNQLIVN